MAENQDQPRTGSPEFFPIEMDEASSTEPAVSFPITPTVRAEAMQDLLASINTKDLTYDEFCLILKTAKFDDHETLTRVLYNKLMVSKGQKPLWNDKASIIKHELGAFEVSRNGECLAKLEWSNYRKIAQRWFDSRDSKETECRCADCQRRPIPHVFTCFDPYLAHLTSVERMTFRCVPCDETFNNHNEYVDHYNSRKCRFESSDK